MTTTAWIITISYSIVVLIGLALSGIVWGSTRGRSATGEDVAGYSHRETAWLVVVLVTLFALLLSTIFFIPYGQSAGPDAQVVRVTGVQFAWAVDPGTVRAGVPVEFLATSRDVNHGFGVYDDRGVLQFQAQVIPELRQKIVHTFHRAGTYTVLCMEFCGLDHHKMRTTFEVLP
jgi:cytochrome c oxidase subunit 2